MEISVGEDKLYRALGELELRLVTHITEALEQKADTAIVNDLVSRVTLIERQGLARAHLDGQTTVLQAMVESLQKDAIGSKAVRNAIRFAIGTVAFGMIQLVLNVVLIIYYTTQ